MKVCIVIPARYGSTRLPGKPLVDIAGEPMIVRVWKRCLMVKEAREVLVATDDDRIRNVLLSHGAQVVMTSAEHRSGTDRICEAVGGSDCEIVVNVQGDEPFIDPASLSDLIGSFSRKDGCRAATLATPVREAGELFDPSVVKVVTNRRGEAIYFSRYPVPFDAELWDTSAEAWIPRKNNWKATGTPKMFKHIGTYAYLKDFLSDFSGWKRGDAEKSESLEQLRILEQGEKIRVVIVDSAARGIDTPSDLARAREKAGA